MKKKTDLDSPATKRDLEDMGAHIVGAISKTLEEYATKEDLKNLATRQDLRHVEERLTVKIDNVAADVSGLRNRVIDLEMKHASPHPHSA